jgi:hypothetical protein
MSSDRRVRNCGKHTQVGPDIVAVEVLVSVVRQQAINVCERGATGGTFATGLPTHICMRGGLLSIVGIVAL